MSVNEESPRRGERPVVSRRSLLIGSVAAGAVVLAGAAPARALTYRVATPAEHAALPIVWGYPFTTRGDRGSGVDGYPGATYSGHIGADYYASPRVGTSVLAVADGTVTAVGDDGDVSRGVFVVVQHAAGVRSEYLHLERGSTAVTVGQRVLRFSPLGRTGNTGDVRPRTIANAHLHLAIFSGPHRTGTVWNPAWLVETAPLVGSGTPGTTPVYRFWSSRYQGHFYTASASERDAVSSRWPDIWSYEGEAYRAFAAPIEGSVPLFRFWSDQYNGHFYTADGGERDAVIARWPGIWRYEGPAFHVYPANTAVSGARPVHRFWSAGARKHFYTASADERDGVIARWPNVWSYEGATFSVPA
ncbi:peptidoglycan DD-metalloendopeptidase family protein [Microbacterium radiodurans]|uniref:peptidoglycan DD-metalloendopeptidase family protein n=1 Tax=Microbacterium radiodurans TaxID=661398 RepID=UPI00168ADBA6|nr:peptidoglycan DD-metalloendopeptidase family protein [Microbacterium radiodurans]